jgi:hypothetical protein
VKAVGILGAAWLTFLLDVGGFTLAALFFPLVGLLLITTGFVKRALRVVVRLQRLAIFVGRAVALAGGVEDLAELHVAPDFGPARIAIAVE